MTSRGWWDHSISHFTAATYHLSDQENPERISRSCMPDAGILSFLCTSEFLVLMDCSLEPVHHDVAVELGYFRLHTSPIEDHLFLGAG